MGRLFGTDGVRGVANSELTPELAFNLGKAGAYVLSKDQQRPVVLIAKDTRISGDMLEDAISAGILAMGGNVIKAGVLPTPAVAYLVRYFKADAGVVISASHNPFEYNGIKFFNGEGFKLDDEIEDEIEDIILRNIDVNSHITGDRLGRCLEAEEDALSLYADFLKSTVDISLEGMKLIIDCANGASYRVAEKIFRELGADVTAIHNEPD
jgi:phosphoglucosamine mutase